MPENFFTRNSLPETTESLLFGTALARFPTSVLIEPAVQGYCSYTLLNTTQQLVLQFRPEKHAIDLEVAALARGVHGAWAPETEFLGFVGGKEDGRMGFYCHGLIPGRILAGSRTGEGGVEVDGLVRELAEFFAQAYRYGGCGGERRGKVGGSLEGRLVMLSEGLPARFRPFVSPVLGELAGIVELPWVLTHGDFSADNVMVRLESAEKGKERGKGRSRGGEKSKREFRLKGVIDWAEAEFLPFGTGLYGLESVLGHLDRLNTSNEEEVGGRSRLREIFWSELASLIPQLKTDEEFYERVKLASLMGVLFWHGIAFDNGALDRVVEEGRDDEEIGLLDEILFGEGSEDFAELKSKRVENSKK
ncbi:hypothetical protein QC761_708775 [Podospora bellae-mahoneyi]|uniref:Aminoglycoside phosphotransferase domain-containing protein n=1 Tax=Podospora bellae-mahoneyi TaxID=2093777 RepID=A0ABR0F7Y2_9PEZI|nr:hypothetical protein QC761_708775 [Podospora bellae-mahoneyi]